MNSIFVNQIGYKIKSPKYAYVAVENLSFSPSEFSVLDENKSVVFTGKLQAPKKDRLAGEDISVADFSSFDVAGRFTIKITSADKNSETAEESYPFEIAEQIYNDAFDKIVHFFYLMRCGMEINSPVDGGKWNHPACHTQIAEVYGNTEIKKMITGGWHDAGDYGRYVIAASKTAMDLMLTYETIKDEQRKEILIDEVRYGLDWMLQMQREDGAVYHKLTGYHFCGFVMPQFETEKQVLAPVSTGATADFAGCLAYASLIFRNIDEDYADKLLQSAIKAQAYLDCHDDEFYQNPEDITTGGYGDKSVTDERYFALTALYVSTGLPVYLEKAVEIRNKEEKWSVNFGWQSVDGYGTEILLKKAPNMKKETQKIFLNNVLERADEIVAVSKEASFGTCFNHVTWGSNGAACDLAHVLMLAYDLTGREEYKEVARKQLDYVYGCNPMNICYVTACGSVSPKNLHHRPSGALKSPMPGMLAGGPSERLADEIAKKELVGKAPLRSYIDHVGSYCTNEIDTYWNSALVYLTGRML